MTKKTLERVEKLRWMRRKLDGSTHTMLFDLLMLIYEELVKAEAMIRTPEQLEAEAREWIREQIDEDVELVPGKVADLVALFARIQQDAVDEERKSLRCNLPWHRKDEPESPSPYDSPSSKS